MRINEAIDAKEIRAIDQDGKQIGLIATSEALKMAEKEGLDLVEVAPLAKPPVCRIMDFGKYRYEQTRKDREARKHQHVVKIKEVRFHPGIEQHDYEVKLKQSISFLSKGYKIKLGIFFRGREMLHQELGKVLAERFANDLKDYGAVESDVKMIGRNLTLVLAPVRIVSKKGK